MRPYQRSSSVASQFVASEHVNPICPPTTRSRLARMCTADNSAQLDTAAGEAAAITVLTRLLGGVRLLTSGVDVLPRERERERESPVYCRGSRALDQTRRGTLTPRLKRSLLLFLLGSMINGFLQHRLLAFTLPRTPLEEERKKGEKNPQTSGSTSLLKNRHAKVNRSLCSSNPKGSFISAEHGEVHLSTYSMLLVFS